IVFQDPVLPAEYGGKNHKAYAVRLQANRTYQIDMTTNQRNFDSFLFLFDDGGKYITHDDDSGKGLEGLDARIIFVPPHDGVYHIIATTFRAGETGPYTLIIQRLN